MYTFCLPTYKDKSYGGGGLLGKLTFHRILSMLIKGKDGILDKLGYHIGLIEVDAFKAYCYFNTHNSTKAPGFH